MFDLMGRGAHTPAVRDPIGVSVKPGDGGPAAYRISTTTSTSNVPDQFPELLAAARAGGPAEFVALAKFAERQVARYDAVQLRALGMIARSRPSDPGDDAGLPFARSVAVDVAAKLGISVPEAVDRLQLAWTLTGRLNSVLEALEAGQINLEQAKAVARWSPPKARAAAERGSTPASARPQRPARQP